MGKSKMNTTKRTSIFRPRSMGLEADMILTLARLFLGLQVHNVTRKLCAEHEAISF